jgi:hypothetical protein
VCVLLFQLSTARADGLDLRKASGTQHIPKRNKKLLTGLRKRRKQGGGSSPSAKDKPELDSPLDHLDGLSKFDFVWTMQ